jgi:O-antigen ligase
LPIALVRLLQARAWRQRLVYGLAICALVAAMLATYRKSALIAPASVLLTIAYFRRRELLKLAPLGVVLLAMVTALSPGALGSTISQFTRSDAAAVPTVSDRTAAYDAIRPDVWTHLLLGRGWGSYDHNTYRILDSEILDRTIETGVIGLLAFILVPVAVVGASRRTIAARDPETAPVALIGASCAVGFLVLAFLFDEMAFPHPVYIFLYLVGLETVALQRARTKARRPPEPSIAARSPTSDLVPDRNSQALVLSGR